jgi:hypothetical protein
MTAPYRDDLAALEARYAALEAEVADRERARDEAARMLAEAKARARNEEAWADLVVGGPTRRKQRAMTIGALVAMAAIGVGAVYLAKRRPSREKREEEMLAMFSGFTDQLCACTNKACADNVQDDMMKWAQDLARHADRDMGSPSPEFAKRMTTISERYIKCYTTVVAPAQAVPAEDPNQ